MLTKLKGRIISLIARTRIAWAVLADKNNELITMEHRIFNAVSVISVFMLLFFVPFNFYFKLYAIIALTSFLVPGMIFAYYLARFRNKLRTGIALFAALAYVGCAFNYYYNSGSLGSTFFFLFVLFHFLITVSESRQYYVWILLHSAFAIIGVSIEIYYPEVIPFSYNSKGEQLSDVAVTYIVIIITFLIITHYLKRQHAKEKSLADKRADDIAKQNQRITGQNIELAKKDAEKNKLFSILSHDMRSPLATMQNGLEMLNMNILDEAESKTLREGLLGMTKNTLDMLNTMLTWSRNQFQSASVNPELFHVAENVNNILLIQQQIAAEKNIHIDVDIPQELELYADPDMFQYIIRNLVNNAIKFTGQGGHIWIKGTQEDDTIELQVKDNGTGISQEKQKDIFSTHIESTYGTNGEKGMGLGLNMCKEFARLMAGEISFTSTPGAGTTFKLSFKKV